jgi:hypothetical protein
VASTSRSGGSGSGKQQRECEAVRRRIFDLVELHHFVFEPKHGSRVDIEREMEVDRARTGLFWVEVDFPELAKRVGLDEVSFVVDVKAMVNCLTLHIGNESCNVDDCHLFGHYRP